MIVHVPCSVGELIDKITILEIKRVRIDDPAKNANVVAELTLLQDVQSMLPWNEQLTILRDELRHVNMELWDVEDVLRRMEKENTFDALFVAKARDVYRYNDERSRIKKSINLLAGSTLVEEKSYG